MTDNTKRLEEIYSRIGGKKPFNKLNTSEIQRLKIISYFASMCEHFDLFIKKEDNNDRN